MKDLPQLEPRLFLTDSGLETKLIFIDGVEIPEFAAFVLLETEEGRQRLREYFVTHAELACRAGAGFIAEAPTWRANPDWGRKLGYHRGRLDACNRAAISLLTELRGVDGRGPSEYVISGCIGPRDDAYRPSTHMSPAAAERYHAEQIASFAEARADLASALTLAYADEAIGVTRAATRAGLPAVISFTLETDGRLPSGMTLKTAIQIVDCATDGGPAYYMVNCAHPTHLRPALAGDPGWVGRLRGIRANASRKSHAELDAAEELDSGDPEELADEYAELVAEFPNLTVLGGCCGTDERHIRAIADRCVAARR